MSFYRQLNDLLNKYTDEANYYANELGLDLDSKNSGAWDAFKYAYFWLLMALAFWFFIFN